MIKTCANCGKIFEGDGRYRYCSDECRKESRNKRKRINYHKYKEQRKQYWLEHKEALKPSRKAYYQEHKEQIRSKARKHYQEHKEYYQIHAKRYYEDHKEQIRIYNKEYYQEHKNNWSCGLDCFSCPYEDCIY